MGSLNQRKAKMEKDWKKLSLKEKLNQAIEVNSFKDITGRWMSRGGVLVFWYTSITIIYCVLIHTIPEYFTNTDPTTKYCYKVASAFLMIQTCANWLCVFFYSSANKKNEEGVTDSNLVLNRNGSLPTHVNGTVTEKSLSVRIWEDTNSDRSGLVWGHCNICDLPKPPRTHHCRVCNKCILKRDHHCFFTNTCIGYYNQRYFVILNFYIALSTFVSLLLDYHYLTWYLDPELSWWGYFLPNTIYHWWYDQLPLHCVIMISHFYIYIWCIPMAVGFFVTQIAAIYAGRTTHELYKQERVRCLAKPGENFRDVFGVLWGINFLFPAVLVFRQDGDGKHWKYIKKY